VNLRHALILAAACFPALCQPPSMPSWLAAYPGATQQTKSFAAYVESTYDAAAAPAAVRDYYRGLFEGASLPFQPGSDGVGIVIRAAAEECDLLITIRAQGSGSVVRTSCAAKSPTYTASKSAAPAIPSDIMERHKQLVEQMGIHKVRADAPAPPLVWPSWLVHLRGEKLTIMRGKDQSHREYLAARFVTGVPMTAIYNYYRDLLSSNDYPVHSAKLGTGQTLSGVVQNADGYVEGTNYPDGSPGPRTEIRVKFNRTHLNDPIDVELRFTTYSYEAPPWQKR